MTDKLLSLCLLLLLSVTGFAQQAKDHQMEQTLDTVFVKAKRVERAREVNIGTRVSTFDEQLLRLNQTKSLSEVLADNSTVYIKSLGQGALSTSSFRGTSASHTQVSWNGININPAMSSSFDFSQIPAFFTDGVSLYHGNSHLKGGTGGLGGSISVHNEVDRNDSSRGRAFVEVGSNDTYTGAAKVRLGSGQWVSQTRVFYQQSENDFRYLNKVLSKNPFYERRQEAAYKQVGGMQELYYRPNEVHRFAANLWYQYGERRLPQPVVVSVTQHEEQKDANLRTYLGYDYEKEKHRFSAKMAYLNNSLRWNKWYSGYAFSGDSSVNRAQSIQLKADYTYTHSSRLRVNGQLNYTYDFVDATNFSAGRVGRDVYLLQSNVLWNPTPLISIHGQVMGEWNDNQMAPTFSTGVQVRLLPEYLTLKGNVAYNYKFPSLNDLYWQPGGNIDLVPEKGLSYDATLAATLPLNHQLTAAVDATYYLMNIDNWIMWLPSKNWFWQPRNVRKVLSHGLELQASLNYTATNFRAKFVTNYTYARSMNRERNFEEDGTYRKQLPYIPKHKANARITADYRGVYLNYGVNYTGIRYTTDDESYSTNAYVIHNAECGYEWTLSRGCIVTPKLTVTNLFNAYYESTQYYPMPLRSFLASVMVSF